ncbi:MAG: agmatinase [Deltaproteobacteria bacterium]|nr:agmatinase [Deltaproteobacteria bacterium]
MPMQVQRPGFGYLPDPHWTYEKAAVAVIPVPYERSTTGGKGTAAAPDAIIQASDIIETFDEERGIELGELGIATLEPLPVSRTTPAEMGEMVEDAVARVLRDQRFPLLLGGEHTITAPAVAAVARHLSDKPTLVQIDAHADLRESYQDDPHSHACAMRLCLPHVKELVQIGVRAVSREEHGFLREHRTSGAAPKITTFIAGTSRIEDILAKLAEIRGPVYLTVDMDGFDPGLVPGVGTPEPGGISWADGCAIVKALCSGADLVAADVVELLPIPGLLTSQVTAAKLIWRILSQKFFRQ